MQDSCILVVDDDPEMAQCIAETLASDRRRCEVAANGPAAIAACRQNDFDVVVSDIRMAGMDGVELMTRLRHVQADLPVVLMTAEGSIHAAVDAVKRGAFQYVTKPIEPSQLRLIVEQATLARTRSERSPLSRRPTPSGTEELIGQSPAMTDLRARIERVAPAASPVLIIGETGTGKEVVARAIHACSTRRTKPFVTVNMAAIPESLLESEMFGHVRGAFTGATQAHRGMLAEADGGTLLLDEIGDMPLALQAKLLRVLQAGEMRAVGGDRTQKVDVRIVAATHRNLPELIREGKFREDLYYRLNVIHLSVPPLRERLSDVPLLAQACLARARDRAPASPVRRLSPELIATLSAHRWQGNVRELQSTIERLVVLAMVEEVTPEHLERIEVSMSHAFAAFTDSPGHSVPPPSFEADTGLCPIDNLVQRHVEAVLTHTGGNKAKAARILGIDLSTLYRWQQKWQP